MTTSAHRRKAAMRGVRLTPRDEFVLDQVIRFHCLTQPLLHRTVYSGLSRSTVYESLERLVRAQMLEDLRTGPSNLRRPHDVPSLYVATRAAYAYRGSPLPCSSVPLSRVHHALGVAQVGLRAMQGGEAVVTDREIHQQVSAWRARRTRTGRPLGTPAEAPWMASDQNFWVPGLSAWPSPRGDITTHRPDLVITRRDGSTYAVEVELSRKNETALVGVLEKYGRTKRFDSVAYYLPDHAMALRLERVVESMNAADRPTKVVARPFRPEWRA